MCSYSVCHKSEIHSQLLDHHHLHLQIHLLSHHHRPLGAPLRIVQEPHRHPNWWLARHQHPFQSSPVCSSLDFDCLFLSLQSWHFWNHLSFYHTYRMNFVCHFRLLNPMSQRTLTLHRHQVHSNCICETLFYGQSMPSCDSTSQCVDRPSVVTAGPRYWVGRDHRVCAFWLRNDGHPD